MEGHFFYGVGIPTAVFLVASVTLRAVCHRGFTCVPLLVTPFVPHETVTHKSKKLLNTTEYIQVVNPWLSN